MKIARRLTDNLWARAAGWTAAFYLMALPLLGAGRALWVALGVSALQAVLLALDHLTPGARQQFRRVVAGGGALAVRFGRLPSWVRTATPLVLLAAVALSGLGLGPYTLDVATNAGIYVLLALGLNVVVGMAGLLVLGFIAFSAVGAYTYGILGTQMHLSFWLALPLGGLLAACFGLLLGLPTLRLRGDYLAIVTLGFGEITRITLNNWNSLTHGPNGILGIPPPSLFGFTFSQPRHYFYLVLALVALAAFCSRRLERSRLGRAWVAMREDETAAESMGVPTLRLKLLAFMIAAFWGGVAGVVFASKQLFISPESFNFLESVMVLCMVVLGGMGSVPGVIVGAILLAFLPEVLRGVAEYRLIVFGVAMILLMQYRPQGLWPSTHRFEETAAESSP
jgi:branched-chain amino acid transport system permease protein